MRRVRAGLLLTVCTVL